jgi:hypothetical protein
MPQVPSPPDDSNGRARGDRAEAVASWYLRVNGFMAIPGFVVHLDQTAPRRSASGDAIVARTEADFVAVRFPYSKEIVGNRPMSDDPQVIRNVAAAGRLRPLFVLAEVKASECRMNGPWTNSEAKNMQRVLRRMGFTPEEDKIEEAASALYGAARWEGNNVIVQYVCFGSEVSASLYEAHESLVQITWAQIGTFLFQRHSGHPEKTPGGFVHDQWPEFGRAFGEWFVRGGKQQGSDSAARFVTEYVRRG